MAKKTVKQIKTVIKKSAKQAGFTKLEYNKDGTPKNWHKNLKKVPMNRKVKLGDLSEIPEMTPEEKQKFLKDIKNATTGKDWRKEFENAIDQETMHIDVSGLGAGRVTDFETEIDGSVNSKELSVSETMRIAEQMNNEVQKVNRTHTVPGQVIEGETVQEPKFTIPLPTTKLEENDLPEYVLAGFMQPGNDFRLESTVTVARDVRIAYVRGDEYFEAIIAIGNQRTINRSMDINTKVIKDGATYSLSGSFADHPMTGNETTLDPEKQPRAVKLYNYFCEKLGLN